VDGAGWTSVLVDGDIVVTGASNTYPFGGIRANAPGGQAATLRISPTGSVTLDSAATGFVFGIGAGGIDARTLGLVNVGVVDVRTQAEGEGAGVGRGGLVNHGAITVRAGSNALGVDMSDGGHFLTPRRPLGRARPQQRPTERTV
jgi:hypothetical protein